MVKLRYLDIPGQGKVIQALIPIGFKLDSGFEETEETWIAVWAERWVQFPTEDWKRLQEQIAQMLQRAIQEREQGETDHDMVGEDT